MPLKITGHINAHLQASCARLTLSASPPIEIDVPNTLCKLNKVGNEVFSTGTAEGGPLPNRQGLAPHLTAQVNIEHEFHRAYSPHRDSFRGDVRETRENQGARVERGVATNGRGAARLRDVGAGNNCCGSRDTICGAGRLSRMSIRKKDQRVSEKMEDNGEVDV
ncbi:hypothetical protein BDW66DRAFT_151399 [Aspergillus desertorum]